MRSPITFTPVARPSLALAAPALVAPFPLAAEHVVVRSVREGLVLALRSVGVSAGDTVLVAPARERAVGRAAEALGARAVALPALDAGRGPGEVAAGHGRPAALVLSHHLGHPAGTVAWRTWCDEHDVALVEDCAHALLAFETYGPVGSIGDAAVFGLAATAGLRGALVTGAGAPGEGAGDRRVAALAAALPHVLHATAQGRRLGHHQMLAAALGERVTEPFRDAARGAAPLVVPVDVADPRVEIERLRGHGVVAAALGPGRVGLPCHHQLTPDQVERVADAAAGGAGRAAGPRRSGELVVEPLGSIEEAREVWLELQERDGNLFGTFEWADAWWRHFGAGRPLHLHLCSDADGRPVGLLPLYRGAQRPLRTVRLVGHGPADRLAPICAPADRPRVAAALRRTLDTLGADVFVADELPADEGWAGLIGGLTLRREASPVLPARGMDFPAFLASRSRNFREQVRRRERALRRHHDVAFRLTEDPEALDADLDVLYRLHEARWEEQSSTFTEGPPRDFHRAFARLALERGWLRLWLLEVDGEPVAAWQGFRYAGSEWYYQSGRETSWDWRSVGFVLLAHSVRAALDEGVDEYRLLRGGEQYKGRFSTFDPELEVVARPLSPLGAAAARAGMGARALPADVRRALVRTAG